MHIIRNTFIFLHALTIFAHVMKLIYLRPMCKYNYYAHKHYIYIYWEWRLLNPHVLGRFVFTIYIYYKYITSQIWLYICTKNFQQYIYINVEFETLLRQASLMVGAPSSEGCYLRIYTLISCADTIPCFAECTTCARHA